MAKEICALCRKAIKGEPVPFYHGKIRGNGKKAYRHEKCL